ncbi:MAG: TIGR04211 family SH3 domain-containing protein [Gammaproteobacteria bacterium]
MKQIFIIFSLFLVLSGNASAETRYVSDRLEITMRSGTSTSHGIIRMLRSGTPVEVLEEDKETGYTHVRTRSGKEGWVLTRFLMKGQAARDRLAAVEKELAELELENRKMVTAMQALREEKNTIEAERSKLDSENHKVSLELAEIKRTASSALTMDSENKELKSRVVTLERNLQTVQQENENLKDRTARDWFMVGAGVLLLGIIVGLIIPRIRWRKKSSWDTF